jgi:hypothetical protein
MSSYVTTGRNSTAQQGLLTEIGRAWFIIDGILLLWDYSKE